MMQTDNQSPVNLTHAHPAQTKPSLPHQASDMSSEPTPRASQIVSSSSLHPEDNIAGKKSPPTSLHSSFNEGSDLDQFVEGHVTTQSENIDKEKKRRWRLSRTRKDDNGGSSGSLVTPSPGNLGSNTGAETSTTTIGSGGSRPRRSFQHDGPESHPADFHNGHEGDKENGKEDPKGPIGWIKNKYREAKENAEQRRNKSPPADRQGDRQALDATLVSRGKSLDIKRDRQDDDSTPDKLGEKPPEGDALPATAVSPPHHEGPRFKEDIKPPVTEAPVEIVLEAPKEKPTEQSHATAVAQSADPSDGKVLQPEAEVIPAPLPAPSSMPDLATSETPREPPKHA
jgi:hypothetical protein